MWLQKWSTDFKPEKDLPIAPAWILLPGLPFHLHTWHYINDYCTLLELLLLWMLPLMGVLG